MDMTKNTVMLIAIVLIGLAISGCTEHSTVNKTTDSKTNAIKRRGKNKRQVAL
jgi:outer membrane murein-binding lipoprotein Lpp